MTKTKTNSVVIEDQSDNALNDLQKEIAEIQIKLDTISSMFSLLVKVLQDAGGVGDVSNEELTDRDTIIFCQQQIIEGFLRLDALSNSEAQEEIAATLMKLGEWDRMEVAHTRVKDRLRSRQALLQNVSASEDQDE